MSRRTAEANKAIRLAWEREQDLVSEGKGTRDWTKEQQQDILDPDKGKAYDDKGRAFEGQHMKSVAEYPEYQGNPDNIQFLTKDEHLEAHKGSWQNPTNWYFNPDTKEFVDFGEGEPVQCKIIDLNDPISITSKATIEAPKSDTKENEISEPKNNSPPKNNSASDSDKINIKQSDTKEKVSPQIVKKAVKGKTENGFIKGLKTVGKFFVSHPVESLEIAAVVVGGVVEVVTSIRGNSSGGNSIHSSGNNSSSTTSESTSVASKVADIVEKANRATPHENDVPAHRQRYHTKAGVVWRDKDPYHRGGNS